MSKLLKEPLGHFLVLGAALFGDKFAAAPLERRRLRPRAGWHRSGGGGSRDANERALRKPRVPVEGDSFLGVPLRDAASCCLYHHYPRIRGVLYFWSVGRSRSVRNTHTVTITARAAQTMSPQPSANAV